jgi:hypothetical protein
MPTKAFPPPVSVAYTAPPSGNVKVEMLRLFKYQATALDRPRVAPNSHSAAVGPLHNSGLFVGLDVFAISQSLTKRMGKLVNAHEVTHVLYDLRNQGLVKFHSTKSRALLRRVSGSGGDRGSPIGEVPVRIQLTRQGLEKAEYSESVPHLTPDDMLPRGPVVNGLGHISDVEGGIPVTDEQENVTGILPEPPEPTQHVPVHIDVHSVSGLHSMVNVAHYPDIHRLVNAERNVLQAAASLRAAGQPDLAAMAEDTLKERSPLQREVIDMVAALLLRSLAIDEEAPID